MARIWINFCELGRSMFPSLFASEDLIKFSDIFMLYDLLD